MLWRNLFIYVLFAGQTANDEMENALGTRRESNGNNDSTGAFTYLGLMSSKKKIYIYISQVILARKNRWREHHRIMSYRIESRLVRAMLFTANFGNFRFWLNDRNNKFAEL